MVLRDSLGGNCRTKMIATVSPVKDDIYESLSTCRFARSVSMIQNKMTKNERVDPGVIIQRLKKEVAELKAELAMAKGGEQRDHLSSEDIERCNLMVKEFIDTKDHAKTLVLPDRLMINQCFYHFKSLYKNMEKRKGGPSVSGIQAIKSADDAQSEASRGGGGNNGGINPQQEAEIQRLNLLVKQRDNEMQIMLTYLNKKKAQDANSSTLMQQTDIPVSRQMNDSKSFNSGNQMDTTKEESKNSGGTLYQMMSAGKEKMTPFDPSMQKSIKDKRIEFELNQSNAQKASQQNIGGEMERVNQMLTEPIQLTMEELADRAKGFEKFRKSYRKNEAMEDNRNLLKDKYKRGKELGQEVNQSRNLIKKYSSQIEEIRKQNAMRGLVDENGEIIKTPEE